ncbi:unnamed protein product [Parnassius apollo]|uniref:(apollo) hypothetical protein n=1 Tax=Parnassius apollo TaxID=110799 RepID=A0A8S3XDV0_PARAO|nr:unnamed protein product [Parnassius apollo]
MSNWVGYAVSVNCGEPLGCYQGTILETDGSTITLTKAFRNGFPYPKSQVTLNAADIKDLKIIEESRPEPVQQTHSTVAVTKSNKKGQRATVCENLQANPSNVTSAVNNQQNTSNVNQTNASKGITSTRSTGQGPTRSKPIDIQGSRINKNSNHAGCQAGSWGAGGAGGTGGGGGSTPGGRGRGGAQEKARRRNEACFGDAADPALLDDFDFEGNLALFDKQRRRAGGGRLRHDESVLGAGPGAGAARALVLPDELRGPLDYRTDDGVLLPSATSALRRSLWTALRESSPAAALCAHVLMARACADVALRLVGGGRRLDARNAHQAPVCVALAGAHRTGAAAVLAARLLHAHAARAHVLPAGDPVAAANCSLLQRELAEFKLNGGKVVSCTDALPSPDLVIIALHDPQEPHEPEQYEEALRWVSVSRGAVVALEPPGEGGEGGRRVGRCARARRAAGSGAGRAGTGAGARLPGQPGAAARHLPRPRAALPPALRRRRTAAAAPAPALALLYRTAPHITTPRRTPINTHAYIQL